jgi:alpha-tubulin suppressor-like RCC1 family protein
MKMKLKFKKLAILFTIAIFFCMTFNIPTTNAINIATPMIAVSDNFALFLKSDGKVWAIGTNTQGQLGDGTTVSKKVPVELTGIDNVVKIAVNYQWSLALKSDGTVWAWGYNYYGQLGNYPSYNALSPVQIAGLSGIISISAGTGSGYALKSDGTVWAWGDDQAGQLGNGTTPYDPLVIKNPTPTQVNNLSNVISIQAGANNGTLSAWGSNQFDELGDGTGNGSYAFKKTPVSVYGMSNVIKVFAYAHGTMAIKSDGTVWGWGQWSNASYNTYPVQITTLSNTTKISLGVSDFIATKSDNTVWSFGNNNQGQLAIGSTTDIVTPSLPVQVPSLSNMVILAMGSLNGYAMQSDGSVLCWGYNGFYMLGDGATVNKSTPIILNGINLIANTPPTISLNTQINNSFFNQLTSYGVPLIWTTQDIDGDPLYSYIYYNGSLQQIVTDTSTSTGNRGNSLYMDIMTNSIGGANSIRVDVTDGKVGVSGNTIYVYINNSIPLKEISQHTWDSSKVNIVTIIDNNLLINNASTQSLLNQLKVLLNTNNITLNYITSQTGNKAFLETYLGTRVNVILQ